MPNDEEPQEPGGAGPEGAGNEAANGVDNRNSPPARVDDVPPEGLPDDTVTADVVAAGSTARGTAAGAVGDEKHGVSRPGLAAYGWTYLIVLFVGFVALALLAFSCDEDTPTTLAPVETSTTSLVDEAEGTPVVVGAIVDGGTVALTGAVPDDGAREQLVALAEAQYGEGNVVDDLTVDAATTLRGGTFSIGGIAAEGDARPGALQAAVAAALGLGDGGFDVTFEEVTFEPVDVEAAIASGAVVLGGVLPDQGSVDSLIALSEGVWGAGNVDGAGLGVGDVTWDGGRVRLTGTIDAGDTRGDAYSAALAGLAPGVGVDAAALVLDSSAEALARSEERLRSALEATPILFAVNSSEIDPASEEILAQAAAAINAAPGIAVEIVGHTDDSGSAELNQTLSAARAESVLNRLVELGVSADRLTSRGAGEDEPIADNTTEEGKAANRRIAFEFQGAA